MTMLKHKKASLASILGTSRVVNSSADTLVVGIKGTNFQLELAEQKESRNLVEQIAEEVLGKKMQIKYQLLTEDKKTHPRAALPKKPAPQEQDPFLKDTLNIFNGQVIEIDGTE